MSEQDESQLGQSANSAMQPLEQGAKKVASGAKKGGSKLAKKATAKLRKKTLLLIKKLAVAFVKAVISLMAAIWPIVLGLFALIAVYILIDHFMIENRGAQQEYDFGEESVNTYGKEINSYGDEEVVSLSEENAFLQIFYQNEVDKSFWKHYKDGDKMVLDYAGGEEAKNADVVDKYGREKFFLLSAMNLYAMDEYLNDGQAITPQTFVQPVPFTVKDDDQLEFKPLTNDEGELQVKSHEFASNGSNDEGTPLYRRKYDKDENPILTNGVWDYGFAPVYHYESFIEKREYRSTITGSQVWDVKEQRMRNMTPSELHEFVENGRLSTYDNWSKEYDLESGQKKVKGSANDITLVEEIEDVEVWMIRDAITPMGAIKNTIEQEWQPANGVRNDTHTISLNVPIEKEREVQDKNDKGKPIWYELKAEGRYVRKRTPLNSTGVTGGPVRLPTNTGGSISRYSWGHTPKGFPTMPSGPDAQNLMNNQIPEGWTIDWRWVRNGKTTTKDTGDSNIVWTTETYYELVEKSHTVQTQGVEWEYIPKYTGEPDTSDLSGLDYYSDYFEYYENYVTKDSIGVSPMEYLERAKEEERIGMNTTPQLYGAPPSLEDRKEGVKSSIKEHPLLKEVRDLQLQHLNSTTSANVDLSGVDFGAESNSDAVQNATEFIDYFVTYGNRYGVDPMMLIALAAHESNGRHFANSGEAQSSGVRRSYTYPENIGGEGDAAAVGIMQIRPLNKGNASKARTVSAFNQEIGQMETFNATASELHDVETNIRFGAMLISSEIRGANHDVLTGMASYHYGMAFTYFVRNNGYGNWSPEAAQAYINSGRSGVPTYIQQVLKYYLPMADNPYPWAMDEDGNVITQNVEGVEFASENAVNIDITNSVAVQKRGNGGSLTKGAEILQTKIIEWGKLPFKFLAKAAGWFVDGVKAFTDFVGWTDNIERTDYYYIRSSMDRSEAEVLIHTMLAYDEGLYLEEYEKMDFEDFEKKFIESFMQNVREQDRTGMRINPLDYFPNGHQSPVKKVEITREYGARTENESHQAGIQLEVAGSTEIYAVADGTLSSKGEDFVVINHGNGVLTHYSRLGKVTLDDVIPGEKIDKGRVIARGASDNEDGTQEPNSFFFQLEKGRFTDPTWIVDPSVISGGTTGLDPTATDFQNPYYGYSGTIKISSPHGWRTHPIRKTRHFHSGQDFSTGGINVPIGAIGDGVVVENKFNSSWGNLVVVHHKDVDLGDGRNVYSLYAHMKSPSPLSVGTTVTRGDVVGNTGTTGGSTGIHLHLEIIAMHGTKPTSRNAQTETINPMTLLPDR